MHFKYRVSFCLLYLSILFYNIEGVSHDTFKTCEQSSFCRRCRRVQPGRSSYELQLDTLSLVGDSSVTAELINADNNVRFQVLLVALKDSTFRLQIDEVMPLRPRYRDVYSLEKEPEKESIRVERDANFATIISGNNKAVIQGAPFKIDFYNGNYLVISANQRGLLRFEHQRTKPQPVEHEEHNNNIPRDQQIDEDPGAWEENFKSHHDTKPYGPNAVALDFSFPGAEQVYGLPEHADSVALKSTKKSDPYRLYNLDVFEYELNSPMALYAAIPFMVAHSVSKTAGIFWLNPSETWIDIAGNSDENVVSSIVNFVSGGAKPAQVDAHFMSETGIIDVFFMLGPKPMDVFKQYTRLTGTGPLPPLFSLAYHQCRWNYVSQDDVQSVNDGFDHYDIPMDVIWLDIEHTDNKKYFTWDKDKFSKPVEMVNNLTYFGRKLVTIVDPHIKRDSGYFLHNDAEANGYYVKNKDGSVYEGWCWPGSSSYLDVFDPTVRDYYANLYKFSSYPSTEDLFIWNDMNEPSVFNGPEITMPKDCLHHGGWEHRDVHNLYGMMFVMSTYKGLLERYGEIDKATVKRPFILSRSGFAGSQRFSAIWTGDNAAEWSHLAISIPMCLSLAISGVSFVGADVGGFFKNPDSELFTRWYQAGAFLPFFRAHSHIDTRRREPWVFGPETTRLVREAIIKRYSLLPFWYTQFYIHNQTGEPVIRPLWVEFTSERATFNIDNEFLIGNSTLVHPVTEPGVSEVPVYFPGHSEIWYDFDTYQPFTINGVLNIPVNLQKIPFYIRGGSIIPLKMRIRRSSVLMHDDPYTLLVALQHNGTASGNLYIDDGTTFQHLYNKKSIFTYFEFANNQLTSKFLNNNHYDTKSWLEKVIIIGIKPGINKAKAIRTKSGESFDLETSYDSSKGALTIRKPELSMAEEWKISLLT
ncbi:glucosidase 2 subunit alpha [Lycorma delicatula]|uniref:glucosidase 2 subunit alpha n=1 Tax=Lycorma delicatula TaxID=130591 RepID=UPI003F51A5AE